MTARALKHIGIVACSSEGAALCYQSICRDALRLVGKNDHPWLHIARVVADEARKNDFRTVGVLGTRFTMSGPVYRDTFSSTGLKRWCRKPTTSRRSTGSSFQSSWMASSPTLDSTRLLAAAALREAIATP